MTAVVVIYFFSNQHNIKHILNDRGSGGRSPPEAGDFFYKFGSHLSHFKCTESLWAGPPNPPDKYELGGRNSTPPGAFEKRKWEGRVDEVGGSNSPNPPGNSNPVLLSFLISLLLLTQLTIKSCLIDLLPSMVSQALPSPYFDPIFLIALIMLVFNLPPLLLSTILLVSLRVLSLVLSFSLSTLLLLVISLKTLIFLFICMPMILNFTSPFQALILLLLSNLYHMPLILSTPASLLIDSLSILIKLNTGSLKPNSNVQKLLIPHFLSMVPHSFQFLLRAT